MEPEQLLVRIGCPCPAARKVIRSTSTLYMLWMETGPTQPTSLGRLRERLDHHTCCPMSTLIGQCAVRVAELHRRGCRRCKKVGAPADRAMCDYCCRRMRKLDPAFRQAYNNTIYFSPRKVHLIADTIRLEFQILPLAASNIRFWTVYICISEGPARVAFFWLFFFRLRILTSPRPPRQTHSGRRPLSLLSFRLAPRALPIGSSKP